MKEKSASLLIFSTLPVEILIGANHAICTVYC